MQNGDSKKRQDELDRFWDIDALIPARRAPRYAADTETAEIVLDSREGGKETSAPDSRAAIPPRPEGAPKRHFIPPHTEDEERRRPRPDEEYSCAHALIGSVRLFRWKSTYAYYEAFVRDAVRLYPIRGAACERVPFFSYVPQYTQMNRAQLEWYLWWRDRVRHGEYPETDYSYVLLYAYELINLSDRIDPILGQRELLGLWQHYRALFRQLDSYLPEWICDYSLIHRLLPPEDLDDETRTELMRHCVLKEFYVPQERGDVLVRTLLCFCTNYDYRKSKFFTEETASIFERVIPEVLRRVIAETQEGQAVLESVGEEQSRMVRDAFTGALCSYRIKRKIEVEYRAVSRTHEVRAFVTDVIKYTENRLRAALGIRSRLGIYALPATVRTQIDAMLLPLLPTRRTPSAAVEPVPAYEQLYDLPKKTLSLSDAAAIERSSWDTTERLIEAFGEEEHTALPEVTPPVPTVQPTLPSAAPAPRAEEAKAGGVRAYLPYLRALLQGDTSAQRACIDGTGLPPQVFADELNAAFFDEMGDVLLEEDDGGYRVIEDYREWLEELLAESGY